MDFDILHEDNHILVAGKPQNLPTQADSSGDADFLSLLKDYLKQKYDKPGNVFLGLVHRLDRPTGGVMVFAKTSKAAERLCQAIREGDFEKEYLAVTVSCPKEPKAQLTHYLKKNPLTNVVSVVPSATEGAKRADLVYEVLETKGRVSLLKVRLLSGRSHQIRVQMAHIGCPVFGDVKYKGDIARGYPLALWAEKLAFTHPVTKERMVFLAYPPEEKEPWKRFELSNHILIRRSEL